MSCRLLLLFVAPIALAAKPDGSSKIAKTPIDVWPTVAVDFELPANFQDSSSILLRCIPEDCQSLGRSAGTVENELWQSFKLKEEEFLAKFNDLSPVEQSLYKIAYDVVSEKALLPGYDPVYRITSLGDDEDDANLANGRMEFVKRRLQRSFTKEQPRLWRALGFRPQPFHRINDGSSLLIAANVDLIQGQHVQTVEAEFEEPVTIGTLSIQLSGPDCKEDQVKVNHLFARNGEEALDIQRRGNQFRPTESGKKAKFISLNFAQHSSRNIVRCRLKVLNSD